MDSTHNGRRDTSEIGVNVTIAVQDAKTGKLIELHEDHNLVTNVGLNLVRDFLAAGAPQGLGYLAVGAGNNPATPGDTALQAEVQRDHFTKIATTQSVLTLTYFLGSAAGNGSTLQEAGLFNAATAGTLFARAVHDAIAKTAGITITYTWQITMGAV